MSINNVVLFLARLVLFLTISPPTGLQVLYALTIAISPFFDTIAWEEEDSASMLAYLADDRRADRELGCKYDPSQLPVDKLLVPTTMLVSAIVYLIG